MAASANLKFCARSLERDVGFIAGAFLRTSAPQLSGKLCSWRFPSDFQRHEVGPGGEVLHLTALGALGVGEPSSSSSLPSSPAAASRQARGKATRGKPGSTAAVERAATSSEPWSAVLYASGRRPYDARRRLASELQVQLSALRTGSALHSPGVAVELVTLPFGLPSGIAASPSEPLKSGLLSAHGQEPVVAIGPPVSRGSLMQLHTGPSTVVKSLGPRRHPWRCEGHRYTVIVRGVSERQLEEGLVQESLDSLSEEGCLNLFPLPSFGLAEVRRYEVGMALWQGQWEKAARLLLAMNFGGSGSEAAAASAAFRQGDLRGGVDRLPESGAEGMRTLAVELLRGRPALDALHEGVPASVWARHLSAVTKLAWNQAASARVTDLPARPLVGDLVIDRADGEPRVLGANDLENVSLRDVVVPLPRRREAIPECTSRLRLETALRRSSPATDAPDSAFPRAALRLMPRTRSLGVVPADLSWDVVEGEEEGPLAECDLAQLGVDRDGFPFRPQRPGRRSRTRATVRGPALRLRFSLLRGTAGEAVVRELLHANPSDFCLGLDREDELF